jgi:hypothetical protein
LKEGSHHQLVEVTVDVALVNAGRLVVFMQAAHRLVLVIGHYIMEISLGRRTHEEHKQKKKRYELSYGSVLQHSYKSKSNVRMPARIPRSGETGANVRICGCADVRICGCADVRMCGCLPRIREAWRRV